MAYGFNADEIFEMAEQIERNGAAFYRKAAENVAGPEKLLLIELAEMEDSHESAFKDMRSLLRAPTPDEKLFDADDLASTYLQAFADRHVFDTKKAPAELLDGSEDLVEILKTAIGLEKDSIVFYLGLREAATDKLGKDKIDEIIREEMKHVATLSSKLRQLVKA